MENMTDASNKSSYDNNKMSSVEVIRDHSRCLLTKERNKNRAKLLNEKRPTLGEVENEQHFWCTKIVGEKAEELKKQTLSREDYTLLLKSLIKDKAHVKKFLETDGIFEALARDLAASNSMIQFIAARCCCNAALENSKECNLVGFAKSIGPYLIAELYGLNYRLIEVCAWTIGNLCSIGKATFGILYAQGCMPPLISLIGTCDESLRPAIIYAIRHSLSFGHYFLTDLEVSELTAACISLNNFSEPEILWILALLSSREASHEQLFSRLETMFWVVYKAVLFEDNIELAMPGIRIFGNTVCEPSGKVADNFLNFLEVHEMAKFFDKLLFHSYLRKESLWLLANFYTHVHPTIRERLRLQLIPLLASLEQVES